MKKLMIAVSALLFIACSKKETKTEESSGGLSDLVSNAKTYNNLSNSMDDITKNTETLKATKPLTNDELKAALPENLSGLKRTEMSVGDVSMMNLASAEAKYSDDNNKMITLQIMDGAGETGSAMVTMMMMGLAADKEKTTQTGFEKSTEINGMKALVSEDKTENSLRSKIQTIVNKRYLLTLDGEGISYDDLAKSMSEINISALK